MFQVLKKNRASDIIFVWLWSHKFQVNPQNPVKFTTQNSLEIVPNYMSVAHEILKLNILAVGAVYLL